MNVSLFVPYAFLYYSSDCDETSVLSLIHIYLELLETVHQKVDFSIRGEFPSKPPLEVKFLEKVI